MTVRRPREPDRSLLNLLSVFERVCFAVINLHGAPDLLIQELILGQVSE